MGLLRLLFSPLVQPTAVRLASVRLGENSESNKSIDAGAVYFGVGYLSKRTKLVTEGRATSQEVLVATGAKENIYIE